MGRQGRQLGRNRVPVPQEEVDPHGLQPLPAQEKGGDGAVDTAA